MNAHDHHSTPAHTDAHTSADPGAVGKQGRVEAEAAKAPTADHYKRQVRQFMADVFSIKHDTILSSQVPLTLGPVKPPTSLIGEVLKFAIGAGGGPFMNAIGLAGLARDAVSAALPHFATVVGSAFKEKSKASKAIALEDFITDYAFTVRENQDSVTSAVEAKITDAKTGKDTVASLHGEDHGGKYSVSNANEPKIRTQTRLETLDAWTVVLQKAGDQQDKGRQGYSDASTGQLHLDSLAIYATGRFQAARNRSAWMEKIGDKAAQYNADRPLASIPVQRTINVQVVDSNEDHFGLSISASGNIRDTKGKVTRDEFQETGPESSTLQSFYRSRHKNVKAVNNEVALADVWDAIKGQTPRQLGFAMKGVNDGK